MSVLNVNMPERDLDPEELDLEQEEEDAFGTCSVVLFLLLAVNQRMDERTDRKGEGEGKRGSEIERKLIIVDSSSNIDSQATSTLTWIVRLLFFLP